MVHGERVQLVVHPRKLDVEDNTGNHLCSRAVGQKPLILAYAHRA